MVLTEFNKLIKKSPIMYYPQKSHFFSVRTNPNPFCTSLQLLFYVNQTLASNSETFFLERKRQLVEVVQYQTYGPR